MKKSISFVMSCLFLLTCISFFSPSSKAAYLSDEELSAMERGFEQKCEEILYSVVHEEYFDGGCAEWTSDQLIGNGIGYWYRGYYSYGYDDGCKWFSELDEGAVTESGYTQVKYPGNDCLYDIIYEFGGYPVYNIVVSWELGNDEWIDAGHVVYLWCIYDGFVYYSDTFDQYFYKAGHMIKQPLEEFLANYSQTSGQMIGAVHFEGAEAVHFKPNETIRSAYTTIRECEIRSAPALTVNEEDTARQMAGVGETFIVKGAYTDENGQRWLKIDGGMWISYDDTVKTANYSTIGADSISVPVVWCYHHGFTMAGTIVSYTSALDLVSITITDADGNLLVGGDYFPAGQMYSISELDKNTYFEHFIPGTYRYTVRASNIFENIVLLDAEFTIVNGTYRDSEQYIFSSEHAPYDAADVNLDGAVNGDDFSMVVDAALGRNTGAAAYFTDINGDGAANLSDVAAIAAKIQERADDVSEIE